MTTGLQLPVVPPLSGASLAQNQNLINAALAGAPHSDFVASATVDIGSVDTLNIVISGNTAITSFGSNANLLVDQFKFVRFSGTPVITHNPVSLICPNGLNINVKANDSALLQYLGGGNWRVYSYFQAQGGARIGLSADTTFYVRTTPAAITFNNGSANITWNGHGLQVNDPVVIDTLPFPTYVTISNANPGVVTFNAHGFAAGQPIKFDSVGYLPPGVVAGTTYFVIATGLTANTFQFSTTVGGAGVNTSKLAVVASNDGSGNILFTATAHGLIQGQLIAFETTGSLPTNISANTPYYVVALNLAANTFSVSTASGGGTPVAFVAAGSNNTLGQIGGSSAYLYGSATATHRLNRAGAMPTFSIAGLLVAGTVYFVGTVADPNNITLSTTLNNANPLGTATVATGSPQYTAVTGNDANGGLAQTRTGAVLSLQKMMDILTLNYDFGGKNVTIQCGSSTINPGFNVNPWVGGGTLTLQGDQTYPPNVSIVGPGPSIPVGSPIMIQNGALPGSFFIKGVKLTATSAATVAAGFYVNTSCQIYPANIELGGFGNIVITIQNGGYFSQEGNITFSVPTLAAQLATRAYQANPGGTIFETGGRPATVTILNTPTHANQFAFAQLAGTITINNGQTTFIGATVGTKYIAQTNGVIQTVGGANFFPGTAAGSTASGGQYV